MAPGKKRKKFKKVKPISKHIIWDQEVILSIASVLLITAFVFAKVPSFDFVNWDDPVNLIDNPHLNGFTLENIQKIFDPSTGTILGNYNPLPIFTFAIEKAIFGLDPEVFHLTNLILHLLCVGLVFLLMQRLGLGLPGAIFGAILFGIHPMRVESVAWITERKDVLFSVFYLGALLSWIEYINHKSERTRWFFITNALFILSLFSKIQAVSLPLSLLAVDYYLRRPLKISLLIEKIPMVGLSLAFGLMGIYFLAQENSLDNVTNYTFLERLCLGAYSYCVYLVKWIYPYEMTPLYPYSLKLPDEAYYAPLGVLLFLGWGTIAFFKKQTAKVFAVAFFTFNIMFLLQILGAGQGFLADRFTYIPYFGLFFLLAFYFEKSLNRFPKHHFLLYTAAVLYTGMLGYMAHKQTDIWENGETLWTHAAKYAPDTDTPFQNLGKYYQEKGLPERAEANFSIAIKKAKNKDIPYNSRGKIYFDKGDLDKALADFNKAIEAGTTISEIYVNRGATHARMGNPQLALPDFNKALELDPQNKQGYLMRSLLHFTLQNYELASFDHQMILKMDPYNADVWYEEGLTQNAMGKPEIALQHFNKAIELSPKKAIYYSERAKTYQMLGDLKEAERDAGLARDLEQGD